MMHPANRPLEDPDRADSLFGRPPDLDLGNGHFAWFFTWKPDLELNPQYADLPGSPDEPVGIHEQHPVGPKGPSVYCSDKYCIGSIVFDTPRGRLCSDNHPGWRLVSLDPLHVEPSLLCSCGDHGFIRDGKWISV